MHKILREKVEVVDVDGSYLYRKHKHIPYGGFCSRITNFANFAEKFVIREIYFLEF